MWILAGLAMFVVAGFIIKAAKPSAQGVQPAFMKRWGMETTVSLGMVTLIAFGLVATLYGVTQLL